jgi:hypothetical protein
MALSFSAVSSGDPIDMMKPPTRCAVIRSDTRRHDALEVDVKSPKSCGQTNCAARSRGESDASTESAHTDEAEGRGSRVEG